MKHAACPAAWPLWAALACPLSAAGQPEPFYKSYDWEARPAYAVSVPDTVDLVALKDKIVREYFMLGENEFTLFDLRHRVLWLNSDKQIEDNNKIYIPVASAAELQAAKARVVGKDGKITELSKSDILTAEDEETKQTYKYFAFPGITRGFRAPLSRLFRHGSLSSPLCTNRSARLSLSISVGLAITLCTLSGPFMTECTSTRSPPICLARSA